MAVTRRRVRKVQTIKAWSYSRYQTWTACPHKARLLYLGNPEEGQAKVVIPASPAMARGRKVHEQGEAFVRHGTPPTHRAWEGWLPALKEMVEIPDVVAERQLAFDHDLQVCEWFSADAYLRMIFDVSWFDADRRVIVDYKTGQERLEHEEQAELYAVGCYLLSEAEARKLKEVLVEYWYLDQGSIVEYTYTRRDLIAAKKKWLKIGKTLTSDTVLAPTPGRACRAYGGCPLASDKLGLCEFSTSGT